MARPTTTLTRRYTKAYLAAGASAKISLDVLAQDIVALRAAFAASPELATTLANPIIKESAPVGIMTAIMTKLKTGTVTHDLVRVVIANGRGAILPALCQTILTEIETRQGRGTAKVETAVPLSKAVRERLAATLSSWSGRQIKIDEQVRPDVLAGLRVRLDDWQIDDTVAQKLDRLNHILKDKAA